LVRLVLHSRTESDDNATPEKPILERPGFGEKVDSPFIEAKLKFTPRCSYMANFAPLAQ
jgi:hypothetical protein